MDKITERHRKRFELLHRIYESTDANEVATTNLYELGRELGLEKNEAIQALQYLAGEGLAKFVTMNGGVGITHWGIKQVEKALTSPDEPTQYFPPVNIMHIEYMINSQVQQGTQSSTQTGTFSASNLQELQGFLNLLRQALPDLELEPDTQEEAEAEITTLEAQINSPKPKPMILTESLKSLRNILEEAAGGVAGNLIASNLLPTLMQVLQQLQ